MLPKPSSPFEQLLGPLDTETRLESALLNLVLRRCPPNGPARCAICR